MKELVEDYFKRDLNPEEEERLGKWLASSSEGSQRLIELAENHFRQLGVQEPDWQEGPLPSYFPKSRSRFLLVALCALITCVLALLGYSAIRRFGLKPTPASSVLETKTNVAPNQPLTSSTSQKQAVSKKQEVPEDSSRASTSAPSLSTEKASLHTLPSGTAANNPSSVPPALAPPSTAQGKLYEELSVVVETAHPGLATVRVLNDQNKVIRLLYAGILAPGQRTFTWDGKDDNGIVASAGIYYLEVNSGAKVMRQEVRVGQTP